MSVRDVSNPLIEFRGVALGYGDRMVLRSLNFAVGRADFLGIVGPNGSGKTTILRAILGIIQPMAGKIRFEGEDQRRPNFGYVPQRETLNELFPFSVYEIVMMGRYGKIGPIRRPGPVDRDLVLRSLAEVGMQDLADRPLRSLSGGQKQRTLIARALASEATILVLDEPTNGMDLATEPAIMSLIRRLHQEHGMTIIVVSHMLNLVANYATRLAILHDSTMEIGPVGQMLTRERLERVYGVPILIDAVGGQRVVLSWREEGNGR